MKAESRPMIFLPVPLFDPGAMADPPALMQIGPDPSPMAPSDLPIPRRRRAEPAPVASPAAVAPQGDRLALCLSKAADDPAQGLAEAHAWLAQASTADQRVRANQCLGVILAQQGQFKQAGEAFADAVALVPAEQQVGAVPLMAMAGNAALAGGDAAAALVWFDRALGVDGSAQDAALGAIHADRSRALVALGRTAEAGQALADARRLAPGDAEVWLLSATLARRSDDLVAAQRAIETAARLAPRDPAIGVEAGVIAVLGGRDDAARRSWQSVVDAAPSSEEARVARAYLAQLGTAPTSAAPPVPPEPPRP